MDNKKFWIIAAMDTAPNENGMINVVKVVHWNRDFEIIDNQKKYYGHTSGTQSFEAPHESSFIPYEELKFEQVCEWLEANLNVEELDAILDQQIENQKNPPIVQLPLPWNEKSL